MDTPTPTPTPYPDATSVVAIADGQWAYIALGVLLVVFVAGFLLAVKL